MTYKVWFSMLKQFYIQLSVLILWMVPADLQRTPSLGVGKTDQNFRLSVHIVSWHKFLRTNMYIYICSQQRQADRSACLCVDLHHSGHRNITKMCTYGLVGLREKKQTNFQTFIPSEKERHILI